jgi:hypothetical protein
LIAELLVHISELNRSSRNTNQTIQTGGKVD